MKQRELSLDYIRIIAIWIILNFHFCAVFGLNTSPIYVFANGGWGCPGTSMFFVLSGLLLKNKYSKISSLKDFYFKRFLAIFPAIYIGYFVCFIIKVILTKNILWMGNPVKLIFTVLGLDNYLSFYGVPTAPLVGEWFTTIIVLLYLVYPLLIKVYEKSKIVTSIVVYGVYIANIFLHVDHVIVDASFFTGLAMFYTGILLSDCKEYISKKYWPAIVAFLVSILIMFVKLRGPYVIYLNLLGVALFIFLYRLFGLLNRFEKLGKPISFASQVSYSVYILHHFILNEVSGYIKPMIHSSLGYVIVYLVYLIFTFIVSIGLYELTRVLTKLLFKKEGTKKCTTQNH